MINLVLTDRRDRALVASIVLGAALGLPTIASAAKPNPIANSGRAHRVTPHPIANSGLTHPCPIPNSKRDTST